ncbi:hypothetical protein, partial [uncultured Duncaniella sp.]|uniref:hypothetical protein n=1 Tax=uncultured Duncaniella sp. TaxID=2768039 RepID=UPI00272978A8
VLRTSLLFLFHFPCTSPLRSDVQGYAEIGVLRTPAHASGFTSAATDIPALASGYTYISSLLHPTYRCSP